MMGHKTLKMHEVANKIIHLLNRYDVKKNLNCSLFRQAQLCSGPGGASVYQSKITSQINIQCVTKAKYRGAVIHVSNPLV